MISVVVRTLGRMMAGQRELCLYCRSMVCASGSHGIVMRRQLKYTWIMVVVNGSSLVTTSTTIEMHHDRTEALQSYLENEKATVPSVAQLTCFFAESLSARET